MSAQQTLSSISANRDLWLEEYRQEVFERDRISNIEEGEERGFKLGLERGIQQGIQRGIEQGIQQGLVTLAKKYMASGHSAEEAAAFAEIDVNLLK